MKNNNEIPNAMVFDLDGTLYLGEGLIDGADDTIEALRSAGIKVVFLTNKPIASPTSYADKLTALGIASSPSDVITSVTLTRDYLLAGGEGRRIYLIGEDYLRETLLESGFVLATCPEETDVVIVSLDRTLDYAKLHFAYTAAREGATIVATNPDVICPLKDGEILDAGASIAALEAVLQRPIDAVLGKPSRRCAEVALRRLDCSPGEVIMVGDRMETDVRMAVEAGMRSALVLTGVSTAEDAGRYAYRPDHVWSSVADIPEVLGLP